MAEKRKRAPGGGRKKLGQDEAQSVKVMVRIRPALRKALQDLADEHHVSLSREIKSALRHWVDRYEAPQLHNSALGTAVAVLADRIERITNATWLAEPATRELVRDRLQELVAHVLTPLS